MARVSVQSDDHKSRGGRVEISRRRRPRWLKWWYGPEQAGGVAELFSVMRITAVLLVLLGVPVVALNIWAILPHTHATSREVGLALPPSVDPSRVVDPSLVVQEWRLKSRKGEWVLVIKGSIAEAALAGRNMQPANPKLMGFVPRSWRESLSRAYGGSVDGSDMFWELFADRAGASPVVPCVIQMWIGDKEAREVMKDAVG